MWRYSTSVLLQLSTYLGNNFAPDFAPHAASTGPTHAILGASLLTTDTKQEQIPPVAYVRERKASHERMHAHITQKQERTGVAESGCRGQETRNYNQMAAIGVALEAAGEAGRSILTIGDNVAL
jgi:hypothetical protein